MALGMGHDLYPLYRHPQKQESQSPEVMGTGRYHYVRTIPKMWIGVKEKAPTDRYKKSIGAAGLESRQ
jgi:hypothetical protein